MTAPQPPNPGEQAWSESGPTEVGPGGNPPAYPPTYQPTQQFAPQEQYGAQPYGGEAYGGEQYSGQQHYGQQPSSPPGYSPGYPPPPPESKTPVWAWALLGVVIVALLGGLGYFAATQLAGSGDAPAATASAGAQPGGGTTPSAVTPSPRSTTTTTTTTTRAPAPEAVSVPAGATACRAGMQSAEFPSSAITGKTSCPFAEEVRVAYLQQPQRDATVSVRAWSPVTSEWYTMSCTGGDVVRCTGGNNATVYVY